jgi:hypothetical protein
MSRSILVRLFDGPLQRGELTGWMEVVATGERRPVRDACDLVIALRSLGDEPADERGSERGSEPVPTIAEEA